MTDHRALKALAESPHAVRALARQLLTIGGLEAGTAWTDWELDFLDSMAGRESEEPLSQRQREVLDELRTAAERLTAEEPTGVRHVLVNGCPIRVDGEQLRGADLLPGGRPAMA